jgi:hypothetical protein
MAPTPCMGKFARGGSLSQRWVCGWRSDAAPDVAQNLMTLGRLVVNCFTLEGGGTVPVAVSVRRPLNTQRKHPQRNRLCTTPDRARGWRAFLFIL